MYFYLERKPNEIEMSDVPNSNRILYYFDWLSKHPSIDINFDYLVELLENGADINEVRSK